MYSAVSSRSQAVNLALVLALAFGLLAFSQSPAEAKPAPPTVSVVDSSTYDSGGMCRHTASFQVAGAKGKWASYEAQASVNGGMSWFEFETGRADIRSNPTIAVDHGFNGGLSFRLRLVKRDTPLTPWAMADPTGCS